MNNCMDCKYRRSTLTTNGYEHKCVANGIDYPQIIDDPNEPFSDGCYGYEQLELTDEYGVKKTKLKNNAFDLISGLVSSGNNYSIDYKYGFVEGVMFATSLLLAGEIKVNPDCIVDGLDEVSE